MWKATKVVLAPRQALATLLVVLASLGTGPVFAQGQATSSVGQADDGFNVTWTIAPSDQYTVTDTQIRYNTCLATNATYTIDFSVTVDTQASYNLSLETVGHDVPYLDVSSIEPARLVGTGPMTFNATLTIRTSDRTVADADLFPILLVPEGATSPDEVILIATVDVNCIAMPDRLPDTGVEGRASAVALLGYVVAAVSLLATGAYLRRRFMQSS